MPAFNFREVRTGRVRTIMGADNAVDAINALTIYPWAFEPIDMPADQIEAVRAYSVAEKAKADERAQRWIDAMGIVGPGGRR